MDSKLQFDPDRLILEAIEKVPETAAADESVPKRFPADDGVTEPEADELSGPDPEWVAEPGSQKEAGQSG